MEKGRQRMNIKSEARHRRKLGGEIERRNLQKKSHNPKREGRERTGRTERPAL